MTTAMPRASERSAAAFGAAALTLLAGYVLSLAFGLRPPAPPPAAIRLVALLPEPPPDAAEPVRRRTRSAAKEAPAPPNLRATPTEIVAPPPVLPPPLPPLAAPVAGPGTALAAGAADIPGPGTGAGGVGEGLGGGGAGDGDGDETPPRWRKGRLKDSDYPDAAADAGIGGTVSVRYVVAADGRVADCEVTRSSGSRLLDETTCRLIRERFRFDPSRDARGRPVPSAIVENHEWIVPR